MPEAGEPDSPVLGKLLDGTLHTAEIHWYEAHGLGRKEYKLKLPLID